MLYRRALSCLISLIPLAGLPAWSAQQKLQLPAWPQTFALAHGEQTSFLVPALKPGAISVTVTWTGAAPTLTLTDGKGKAVTTVAAKTSPAKLDYTVTQADLARGPIWFFTVKGPAGNAQPTPNKQSVVAALSGSVTATYPPVDEAALAAALTNLKQQQATSRSAFLEKQQKQQKTYVPPAADKIDPARTKQLAEQEKTVRAKFASAGATKQTPVAGNKQAAVVGAGPKTKKPINVEALEPSIASIAPSNGCVDDVVTLTCLCLADAANTDVVFHFGSATLTAAPVAPGTTNNNGQSTLRVKVPKSPTNYTATTSITVTVVDKGRTPSKTSAPATFAYDPYAAPIVMSLEPAILAANGTVLIRGGRFQQGDVARFVLPGQGDVAAQTTTFVAEDRLRATVPEFFTSEPLTGTLYVKNQGNRTSGPISFITTANQSAVNSVYPTQAAPWEHVTLSGALLKNVRDVTVTVRPRAQQSAAYLADRLYATPLKMTVVQSSDNALLLRVPTMEGFSGPLSVDLSIAGVGKPVTVPFTVAPEYFKVHYRVPCTTSTFQQKEAGDKLTSAPTVRSPYWLAVTHDNNFWGGHRTDETFYSTPWLLAKNNNWSFVSADLPEIWALFAGARLTDSGVTPDGRIYVSVHSYVDTNPGGAGVLFFVKVVLRGPRGVPMVYTPSGQTHIPDSSVYEY